MMGLVAAARRRPAALVAAARLVVSVVFAWAAVGKLGEPAAFAESIRNYHVVPDAVVPVLASILPVLEVTVAAALLGGVCARGAATCAAGLLVAFTLGMIQAMARGIDVDCGCFGAAGAARIGWLTVVRNLGLLVATALVATAPVAAASWPRRVRERIS